jgi:hypothetical protein
MLSAVNNSIDRRTEHKISEHCYLQEDLIVDSADDLPTPTSLSSSTDFAAPELNVLLTFYMI